MPSTRLEVAAVKKRFPGVIALDGVSIRLEAGEVLAVVGENGAGKSTLMKIIAGIYQPDEGTLLLDERLITIPSPGAAIAAGISLIHQELNLAENLSVLDNLFLGREPTLAGGLRILDRRTALTRGEELLRRVGLPLDRAHRLVESLPPGEKQLVEIARALGTDVRVLIMDEPTSSLTQRETERLYDVIDALRESGVSILYISHRLAEVKRCADRVTVLRDGKNAGELARSEINHDAMVRLMVGRDMTQYYPRQHRPEQAGATVLKVEGLRFSPGPATPASFELRAGEILGMAGLVGAGRTELSEAIFGIRKITEGTLKLDREPIRIRSPRDAISKGILLIPEDRRLHGLVVQESVGFNLSLPNLEELSSWFGIRFSQERNQNAGLVQQLRVKTPSLRQTVGLLSGGNQQKVVYGKWLARSPRVLILDEPTRGVDVGAKAEIYGLIDELAGQGVAVWMITSDMEELLGMSDRVVVMHEGTIAGELTRDRLTEEAVMRLATGVERS